MPLIPLIVIGAHRPPAPTAPAPPLGRPPSALGAAPTIDARDEVAFWMGSKRLGTEGQINQHALFMALGLEDEALRAESKAQHAAFESFRRSWDPNRPQDAAVKAKAIVVDLLGLQKRVLDRMAKDSAGAIGWLFPSFIEHLMLEERLFLDRLAGGPNARAHACTWIRVARDHAAFARQLLDPSEVRFITDANHLLAGLDDLYATACSSATLASLVEMGERAGTALDAYFTSSGIGTPKVKSVVHPLLAAHVVREGQRMIGSMRNIAQG